MLLFEVLKKKPIICSLVVLYIAFCIYYLLRIKTLLHQIKANNQPRWESIIPDPKKYSTLITFFGMVIFLIPRFLFILICILTFIIVGNITHKLKSTKVVAIQNRIFSIIARIVLFLFGVLRIKETYVSNINWKKYPHIKKSSCRNPPVIISNHIGYFDIIYSIFKFVPSFIAGTHAKKMPIVGEVAQALKCVFVDRKDKMSKEGTLTKIVEKVNEIYSNKGNKKVNPPLFIFPEGIVSKDNFIKPFKRGAFAALKPIQPIHIGFASMFWNSAYYWFDLLDDIVMVLSQPYQVLKVSILPQIEPVTDDVTEYCNEVQKLYVDVLKLTPCSFDIFERDDFLNKVKTGKTD